MPTWPATLPQRLLVEGYEESPPDLVLRTQMDVGPPKLRPRGTAGIRPITGRQSLTKAQVEALDVFYVTTCARGTSPFDWTHPRKGTAATFVFRKPPRYQPEHGDCYWVYLELDLQP